MSDFQIEYSMLVKYMGKGGDVIIPSGVTIIGYSAFVRCTSLTNVVIPNGVKRIDWGAFYGCTSLTGVTIPGSVTGIGNDVFKGCNCLSSIVISDGAVKIGEKVFGDRLPDGLKTDMRNLAPHLTDEALAVYFLKPEVWNEQEKGAKEEVFLARQDKKLYTSYVQCMTADDVSDIADTMLQRLAGKPAAKDYTTAANLMMRLSMKMSDDKLNQLYTALKGIKGAAKAVAKIEADENVAGRLKTGRKKKKSCAPEELLIARASAAKGLFQEDVLKRVEDFYSIDEKDLPKLLNKSGKAEPKSILAWLLTAHEERVDGCTQADYEIPGLRPEAAEMMQYLDAESLQKALIQLADRFLGSSGNSKKMYLAYPICRYADEATMNELLKRAPEWSSTVSGKNAPPLRTFRKACIYNEQRQVILFADKYGDLNDYARIRKTDAQTIRDTSLADFGLDAEGRKHYDIGGTTIDVSLKKDLSLSLFDRSGGKIVKSIPKRGNDETLVAAATKDLNDLKKNIKKVAANRFVQLFADFLKGTAQSADRWKAAYLSNPILRTTANLIVWQQGRKTFILKDNKPIHADGTAYAIGKEAILVAHPMEMSKTDIAAWQAYFLDNGLKQPFEQVWEPVIQEEDVHPDRYAGLSIPYSRFLNAEKHGIRVYDLNFHNDISICFSGCSADVVRIDFVRHMISPNHGFEVRQFNFWKYTRQVNHIVAYLDKASLCNRILKDDASVTQYLHNFTLAQVMEFIRLASENNAVNVTAALLEYKNEHFGAVDPTVEFTLDW